MCSVLGRTLTKLVLWSKCKILRNSSVDLNKNPSEIQPPPLYIASQNQRPLNRVKTGTLPATCIDKVVGGQVEISGGKSIILRRTLRGPLSGLPYYTILTHSPALAEAGFCLIPFQLLQLMMLSDFFKSLGLNLSDSFAGYPKNLPYFLQGMGYSVFQPKPHF